MMPSCKWESEYARWRSTQACGLFLAYVHFFGGLYEFPTNKGKQKSLFTMLVLFGLGWSRPWVWGVKSWHRKQYQGVALSMCLTAEGATSSSTHPVQYILQITKIALSLWNLLLLWIFFSMLSFIVYNRGCLMNEGTYSRISHLQLIFFSFHFLCVCVFT